jgi:hypothetical protein
VKVKSEDMLDGEDEEEWRCHCVSEFLDMLDILHNGESLWVYREEEKWHGTVVRW